MHEAFLWRLQIIHSVVIRKPSGAKKANLAPLCGHAEAKGPLGGTQRGCCHLLLRGTSRRCKSCLSFPVLATLHGDLEIALHFPGPMEKAAA